MERLNLPITGICSFGKYEICTELEQLKADIAVLGVPYDLGVGYLSGARLGPRRIREASTQYARGDAGFYDFETDRQLLTAPLKIVDCGDADVLQGDVGYCFDSIRYSVEKMIEKGAVPIIMGGDHSITIPVLEAFRRLEKQIHILQFDAHLDWKDQVAGQRYGNGSPMRRASEMEHIEGMTQIGLRGIGSSTKTDFEDARSYGSVLLSAKRVHEIGAEGVLAQIPEGKNYFLTIDIDGYDMSIAPGVASPYPGGLLFGQVVEIIRGIARKGKIVGADIAEVAPQYDPSGITVRLAALTLLQVMAEIGEQKKIL